MAKGKFLIPALVGIMTVGSIGMTTLAADTTTNTKTSISEKKTDRETTRLKLEGMSEEERKAYLEEIRGEKENIKGEKPNTENLRGAKPGADRAKAGKHFNGLTAEEIAAFKDMTEEEKKAYLEEKFSAFENMTQEEKEAFLANKHNKKSETPNRAPKKELKQESKQDI